ncbi:hypothetical protein CI109_103550 [Kwoniella shandongensis]|uniref:E3 ubiquitin-protein ligase listerin n=1 Tax=Kwoniella shandongensis TaxID=1734106 RepID=A0A5M6BWE5_9TREE|nr:uncharacterized protein CI109_004548 [Kwoniella shandongensis]KAA5527013.1 hypothetical protein CI109_004548 [Kwoniella shandongensis]
MAKSKTQGSSASAGTRKKHAKKAGKDVEDDQGPSNNGGTTKQRGQKKLSKAQKKALPKVKQYIPPPKPPAPPIPDPLDGQGLARTLPAELVVVLRRLGKKDDVTRRKGLEELRDGWVSEVSRSGGTEDEEIEKEIKESALLSAIPVWLHNLASLLQSPFHRSTAIQLHADFLSIPSLRSAILETLSLSLLPSTQNRDILGSWMVAALEEGRRAGSAGIKSWEASTSWKPAVEGETSSSDAERIDLTPQLSYLVEYLTLSILDPATLHDNIHPAPVATQQAVPSPAPKKGQPIKGGKAKSAPTPPSRQQAATPAAEDDELIEERLARYRVGGLTGLAWLLQQLAQTGVTSLPTELVNLLRNPLLWTALSSNADESSASSLGVGQPPIRRAGYSLLTTLLETFPAQIEEPETLQMVSNAVLGNCWLEKEAVVWETAGPSVARFLRKWPQCWTLTKDIGSSRRGSEQVDQKSLQGEDEEGPDSDNDEDDGEDESDDGNDAESDDDDRSAITPPTQTPSSAVYGNFLEFISTICPSVPHLTYPLLLVVISTLPSDLLPLSGGPSIQLQNLFSHLWSPIDSRLLSTHSLPGQQSNFQAFFQAILDSTGYLIGKAWSVEDGKQTALTLAKDQFAGRAWRDGVLALGGKAGGRRGARGTAAESEAAAFGKALGRLAAIDTALLGQFDEVLGRALSEACFPAGEPESKTTTILPRSLPALSALRDATDAGDVKEIAETLVTDLVRQCVDHLATALPGNAVSPTVIVETLVEVFAQFPQLVDSGVQQNLVSLIQNNSTSLVSTLSPTLFVSLLDATAINSTSSEQETLRQVLYTVLQSTDIDSSKRFAVGTNVLGLESTELLQSGLVDNIATEATQVALLTGSTEATAVVTGCLKDTKNLSQDALDEVLALTCTSLHDSTERLSTTDTLDVALPRAAFEIFSAYAGEHLEQVVASDLWIQSLVAVHHVLFLLPRLPGHIAAAESKSETLAALWTKLGQLSAEKQATVLQGVHNALRDAIQRVDVHVDPSVLIDVALATTLGTTEAKSVQEIARVLLPPTPQLVDQISSHAAKSSHPSLPIVDSIIPYSSEDITEASLTTEYDTLGRSKAARCAEAAVALLRADRHLVNSEPALLQVALAAVQLTQDALAVPGSSRGLFSMTASITHLSDLVREVEGAISYALAFVDEVAPTWHASTVQILKTGSLPGEADLLQRLLSALKDDVTATGGDVSARSFRDLLSRHLRQSGAGESEGEAWLTYAMTLVDRAPQLALAIILAIKPFMLDTKSFATAQNRLANAVTSIRASQVAKSGIPLLRILVASAPPADAASVFLPQQRALFVLRHVTGWLTSDDADDLPEEVEYRIAELETAVAPIVQDLSGAHWDGIFDLVESGLEASKMDDPSTLCLLYQSLVLLQQIRDLCQTNKALRASWTAKDAHMKLVLDLFLQCRNADTVPLQYIQGLILDLLVDVPETVMENASLGQLCDLLKLSTSSSVQSAAYRILSRVIRHETLALVLEVETSVAEAEEGHAHRTIELPNELVGIVEQGLAIDWHGEVGISAILGQLLSWMAILDHFEDASRALRWAYLDQLNTSKLLTDGLVPMLFAMLGVSEMGAWNFPASQYAVDEFYPDLLDPEEVADLTPLASHLYYRALVTIPSSLRSYYESLKDRQLSMSMLTFTARHYSPVIIGHEFAALRQPASMAQLTEEGLNVRIAQGGGATVAAASGSGSAEAIASYVVDEQPMEIGIRLPAEFPLKGVDVRDLRRVGVPENKWRGWLMSVQQTITSRNGLILEALTVFKKNVSLHFEGVVECAICYSIISLTDRTLPTKPCRTCKNRFHASCLFKWFNSSHSSSCPMCRALF